MKPAWDKLGTEFADSKTVVIGDVDCTVQKDLCSKYGVRGYPTIKYFTGSTDPTGDKYEGGRDFDSLKAFVTDNLGPSCDSENKDLCNEEQLKALEDAEAMSPEDREAEIKKLTDAVADAEKTFKDEVDKLQKKYKELMEEKDAAIAAANGPLRVLRSVKVPAPAAGHDEL